MLTFRSQVGDIVTLNVSSRKMYPPGSHAINGKRDQLEGKLQEHYGYSKDQTKKEIDDWFSRLP